MIIAGEEKKKSKSRFSNEEKDAFLYALARITGNLIDEINSWEEHEVGKDSFPE